METLRQRVARVVFKSDTLPGRVFDLALIVLILFSVTGFVLESVAEIALAHGSALRILDWVITALFTLELTVRFWCAPDRRRYLFSFYGVIDILAVLPTYVGLFFTGIEFLTIVRIFRLLRVFQVLKMSRYVKEASKIWKVLKASMNRVLVFIFFLLVMCVFSGTILFVVEGPEHGFSSIPVGIYWAVVTLTTVGYGDISPQTPLGQALAVVLMILGYGVIAVPTGLVSAEWVRQGRKRRRARPPAPDAD